MERQIAIRPEATNGIETIDVAAVNRKADRHLYAARQKVYAKRTHGTFRTLKWLLMFVTLGIYYALPWLKYDRGPDLPDQAVLLDLANRRFFFFFLEIWPQEFYFVTGLLVIAALSLFLITSLAGRVWCGYLCPQTVWTDLMVAAEHFWQGDRNARIRLDKEPWGAVKVFKKIMTHLTWLLIGVATGGALIFYFGDPPTLIRELMNGTASIYAYVFLAVFTFTTYLLGGIAREQVCIYMCPWPRIQGAMVDHDSLLVSYRPWRGEPRGPHRKGASWEGRGDCIDCKACVAVCPMGIDIRDGAQLECIQCALCIDACNDIMARIGRPRNLIAYDTIAKQEAGANCSSVGVQLVRPRTILYAALISLVGVIMLLALMGRTMLDVNALADRNPLYVRLANGDIRNGYTLKILNKQHEPRTFSLEVVEPAGAKLALSGTTGADAALVTVPTDSVGVVRAFVTMPGNAEELTSTHIEYVTFIVRDTASGLTAHRRAHFEFPRLQSRG